MSEKAIHSEQFENYAIKLCLATTLQRNWNWVAFSIDDLDSVVFSLSVYSLIQNIECP